MKNGRHKGRPSSISRDRTQTEAVIHCSSFCFGWAPTWRDASSPFLNSIKVGIDMMPYFAAVAGFSSTLSLTILTFSPSEGGDLLERRRDHAAGTAPFGPEIHS
jgi:hypothetical protein